eukprot:g18642.t1
MTNDGTIAMRASPTYTALSQTRVGAPRQPILHHPRLFSVHAATIRKTRLSRENSSMSLRSRSARPALSTSSEDIASVSRAVEAVVMTEQYLACNCGIFIRHQKLKQNSTTDCLHDDLNDRLLMKESENRRRFLQLCLLFKFQIIVWFLKFEF